MNQSQEKALKYLTGYDNLESVPVETLKKLTEDEPYFPISQFLLARKLQGENKNDYQAQVQKTVLFFSNPFWLDYQLNSQDSSVFTETEKPSAFKTDNVVSGTEVLSATTDQALADHPITDVFSSNELNAASELAHETLQGSTAQNDVATTGKATDGDQTLQVTETEHTEDSQIIVGVSEEQSGTLADQLDQNIETVIHADIAETTFDGTTENEAVNDTESTEIAVHATNTAQPGANDVLDNQPEEEAAAITRNVDTPSQQFLDNLDQEVEPPVPANVSEILEDASTPAAETETVEVVEEMAGVIHETDATTEAFLQEIEPVKQEQLDEIHEDDEPDNTDGPEDKPLIPGKNNESERDENDEHERMFLNIKAMLDASSEEANAETKGAYIPIDPYYTIDYFASQGIKLDLDHNPQDQLGKNLKKFTQWLKHMKKLGPEDALETIKSTESEADIQQIADSSNIVKEVVTEAMALVLEKQGKKEKAIELYNKLSFLNPDKSAYFAAKIKNLKGPR